MARDINLPAESEPFRAHPFQPRQGKKSQATNRFTSLSPERFAPFNVTLLRLSESVVVTSLC
jgi:hypothetical protein